MADKRTLSDRLDELAARFNKLEERVYVDSCKTTEQSNSDSQIRYCAIPAPPQRKFAPQVSADRAAAILVIDRKWLNRTNLHYYFFDSGPFGGSNSQQEVVRRAFDVWKNVGIGLTFTEVSLRSESELRIGFRQRVEGSWSAIGTQALEAGQQERTMNFGWDITVPGPNGLDTAVHEIGHALGFHHEHQNWNAGIVWNREAVYDYFARTQDPPWDREKTDFNVLNKVAPQTAEGSIWDPNSIMHYPFSPGLIRQPEQYRNGINPAPGLSQSDIEVVKRFYPEVGPENVLPELKPGESKLLALAAGEQQDFNVIPSETRNYDFQTFGQSDTVMVLFEAENGDFRYVKGDDDSGFERNASFRVRLVRGRKYQLRVRLYFNSSSGDTAVMMW